jgi:lipopolysaccharide/colanic/teichoic acid biosynthesis glycosyltransferase
LARRHGINQKTVAIWKSRSFAADLPTGHKDPRSGVAGLVDGDDDVFQGHVLVEH